MAAAKLVTRCPACRTAFRLVADQLRLRQGLVRCGQCDTVFDAREHLIEMPVPAAAPASKPDSRAPVTVAAALAHAEQSQATARTRNSEAPFDPGYDPGYDVPALDSPTMMMSDADAEVAAKTRAEVPVQTTPAGKNVEPDVDAAAEDTTEAKAEAEAGPVRDAEADVAAAAGDAPDSDTGSDAAAVAEAAEAVPVAATSDAPQPDPETTADRETEAWAQADPEVESEAEALAEAVAEAVAQAETEIEPTREAASAFAGDVAGVEASAAPEDGVAEDAPTSETAAEPSSVPSAPAQPEPADEAPMSPPVPWPALDHSAFGDSVPGHSSLAPAAALASATTAAAATSHPPAGAYNAKATWPPVPSAGASSGAAANVADTVDDLAATAESAESLPAPNPFPATEPVRSASEYLRAADPTVAPAEEFARTHDPLASIPGEAGDALREGTPDAVARETTTRHWLRRDAQAGPVFAPDFLRHSREREPARAPKAKVSLPGGRTWARAAVVVLALGALLEGAYLARSQLAGSMPVLRPVLEAACAPLGCDVPPWRDLEALRIDSSQLQKQDEAGDVYQLAVTMRNQGRATTALPAIELVMTDLQDQLLLRRVLQPGEYLEPAQRAFATMGLRAGSELPVRVRFRTQQAAANYRVLIFYP